MRGRKWQVGWAKIDSDGWRKNSSYLFWYRVFNGHPSARRVPCNPWGATTCPDHGLTAPPVSPVVEVMPRCQTTSPPVAAPTSTHGRGCDHWCHRRAPYRPQPPSGTVSTPPLVTRDVASLGHGLQSPGEAPVRLGITMSRIEFPYLILGCFGSYG
jgi:hypothetical protein